MPAALMQERLLSLIGTKSLAPFKLLTPDLQQGPMPDLATNEGQMTLEPYLEGIDLLTPAAQSFAVVVDVVIKKY